MRYFVKLMTLLVLVFISSAALSQTVSVLPNAMTQFVDGNGAPYAGGHVYMYVPGTTTPKATYQTPLGTSPNANPITLDANGRAIIWGSGEYRQVLQDVYGVVVWDQLTYASPLSAAASGVLWYGTATGTANAITLASPAGFVGTDGQQVGFLALTTNSASTTINASGYGSVLVEKNTPLGLSALTGGEIIGGTLQYATYSATANAFVLAGPPTPLVVVQGGTGSTSGDLPVTTPGSTTARGVVERFGEHIDVLDYGGDPAGVNADNDGPFALWWTACMATHSGAYVPPGHSAVGGNDCFIPVGHYKFTNSAVWDFVNNQAGGGYIHGAGANATLLDFTTTANADLLIEDSGNVGYFYPHFANFGVVANNTAGPAVQVGQENYADQINGAVFQEFWAQNNSYGAGTAGIEINSAFNIDVDQVTANLLCPTISTGVATCTSGGDALRLRAVQFSNFKGSFGTAHNSLHITGGYTGSNVFSSLDLETSFNNVVIDSANAYNNTFIGGTYNWCNSNTSCPIGTGYAIIATAGTGNVFINPTFAAGTAYDVYTDGTCANNVGVLVESFTIPIITPSVPASTTALQNCTTRRVFVNGTAGSVSQFCFGVGAGTCLGSLTTGVFFGFVLQPQDSMTLTYTSSPGMDWTPVQ